jgi:hypothetical protein
MVFKTPVATLAAIAIALLIWPVARMSRRVAQVPIIDRWGVACLTIAPVLYAASAMTTNLNLGLRHVLPVYPFVFIALGLVVGRIIQSWNVAGKVLGALLCVALLAESLGAYPHYLAFFNLPSGGSRGGIRLLGDSNLDWGQDLPLLAQWQRDNPDKRLFIAYFGMADPEYYGIKAPHLPWSYNNFVQSQAPDPRQPAVLAISATHLQGLYLAPQWQAIYGDWRKREPFKILGGSIYLYDFPPAPSTAPAPP